MERPWIVIGEHPAIEATTPRSGPVAVLQPTTSPRIASHSRRCIQSTLLEAIVVTSSVEASERKPRRQLQLRDVVQPASVDIAPRLRRNGHTFGAAPFVMPFLEPFVLSDRPRVASRLRAHFAHDE
jgi:hypothetical protein